MAQRKKQKSNKKSNKKSKKTPKHIQNHQQTIIQQAIPNYSSGQTTGHQYNKNKVTFVPPHAENATDNIVGELVGRIMSKIENDGNKQTQEYSKEIKPINNTNSSTVNIYNNGTIKEEKKDEEKNDSSTTIINNQGRSAGEDYGIQTAAGLSAIGGAAAITAGIRNRKKIGEGIKNLFTSAGNRLGGISERSRLALNPRAYNRQIDEASPQASRNSSFQSALEGTVNQPRTRASSVRSSQSENVMDSIASMTGITPSRARASSESYNRGTVNLIDEFNNTVTPAARTPALNSEQRRIRDAYVRQMGLDSSNRSPINTELLRARTSAIQQHDGVQTRSIRAQTREPHEQLEMQPQTRGRGRPRINEYPRPIGPARPRGRPRSTMLSQAQTPTPNQRLSVARNLTKSGARNN